MAIKINSKEYLTYEEQVLRNKEDIEKLLASKNIIRKITITNDTGETVIRKKLSTFLAVSYKVDKAAFTIKGVYRNSIQKDYKLTLSNDEEISDIYDIKKEDYVRIMYDDLDTIAENNSADITATLFINDKVYKYKGAYKFQIEITGEEVTFVKVEDVCLW